MNHKVILGLVLALICWRLYDRLRRNIGRQPFRPRRLKAYIVLFSAVSLFFALRTLGHSTLMLGWIAGVALGAVLGVWALRLTRFEATPAGRFFTPNGHIGVALSLLFVARIVYRIVAIYSYAHLATAGTPPKAVGESALTFVAFELLAAYSIVHSSGVLRHFRLTPAPVSA